MSGWNVQDCSLLKFDQPADFHTYNCLTRRLALNNILCAQVDDNELLNFTLSLLSLILLPFFRVIISPLLLECIFVVK